MSRRSPDLPSGGSPPTKIHKQDIHQETHVVNDELPSSSHSTSDDILLENDVLPSTSHSTSDDILLPKLPFEVVERIFKYNMPIRDRLNASVVCKEWNEAARFSGHFRYEKLVFYGCQDLETLFLFLSETKRKILNLEFRSCELSSFTLSSIADKIHSVRFYNCRLSLTFLNELFVKCVNLNEFYFKTMTRYNYLINLEMAEVLKKLEEKQFANENLTLFCVNSNFEARLVPRDVRRIFKIFPSVKHFAFRAFDYQDPVTQERVSLKPTLEILKLYPRNSEVYPLVNHTFPRLKSISLFMPPDIPETLVFDFFSRLKYLERISYSNIQGSSFATRFLQRVLLGCSHLKHLKLKFRVSCRIDLSPQMFRTLVSSKLISLQILNPDIRPTSEELFTTWTNALVNETLRELRIPIVIDHRMQSLFVQSFRNLKYLQLQCFSGTVLESIGQYQKNLTTLKLNLLSLVPVNMSQRFISTASSWTSSQAENCLQSLTRLEDLDCSFDGYAHPFDCQWIPPSVKYLCILYSGSNIKYYSEDFWQLMRPLAEKTELETIYIELNHPHMNDLRTWSEICRSLNKLRLLSLHWPSSSPQIVERFKTLYESCPSLRFFIHENCAFLYDYADREIKQIDSQSQIFDIHTTNKIALAHKYNVMYM